MLPPPFSLQISMVMVLPDELWEKVADFLRSPSLSHVCKRLFFLLGCRHVTVRNGFATVLRERLAFLLERKDTTLDCGFETGLIHFALCRFFCFFSEFNAGIFLAVRLCNEGHSFVLIG